MRLFSNRRSSERAAVLTAMMLAPLMWGCGKQKQPWEKVYPANGSVTFKGKPVANAEIALFPQDGSIPEAIRPKAKTSDDGAFSIWTFERGDGAPAGKYKATVVHHDVVESKGVMVTKPNDLPRKYATQQTTDLEIEISPRETAIPPIELK